MSKLKIPPMPSTHFPYNQVSQKADFIVIAFHLFGNCQIYIFKLLCTIFSTQGTPKCL